jgi:hypothetical protein
MRSPDIEPARLERLLAGFAPETAQEAILQGLVRELRGGMAEAPLVLRERVRMICEPSPRPRTVVTRRRLAVVLVAALVALAGGIFASTRDSAGVPAAAPEKQAEALAGEAAGLSEEESGGFAPAPGTAVLDAQRATGAPHELSGLNAGRAQDIDLTMAIRVPDADAVSQATNEALALTKDLGGFVRSSNVSTQGREGTAKLRLRIPVARFEDAVIGLSALGTITKQQVATVDLQGDVDAYTKRIERLGRAIEADRLRLESGTLTAEEKLVVELRLARTRAELRDARRERSFLVERASMADLTLAFHTREGAAAAKEENEGGVAGAVRTGLDLLAAAGVVSLLVLIVASPLIVIAFVTWFLLRFRRRRLEERLLADPRPAGPPRAAE